jgi:hypothetical protein
MLFEVLQMLLILFEHFRCCLGIARFFGVLLGVIISVFLCVANVCLSVVNVVCGDVNVL